MTYNVRSDDYFRADSTENEMRRVFDICHHCRRCVDLCPAFPALFEAIDRHQNNTHGVDNLVEEDLQAVVDGCYNCKECYARCPYTPPDAHDVDFPRLMLRAKAVNTRQRGPQLRNRLLAHPHILGRLGSRLAPLANSANGSPAARYTFEKVLGVHRDYPVAPFATTTFDQWYDTQKSAIWRLNISPRLIFVGWAALNTA
ncbi:MAG: 4Fe-4S dicluster domain-containing protein [Myxococcota bacterium]